MLLKGRPLYDNKADANLFITPPIWNAVVHGSERELNVLLVGPRGSGKTSLLHQIQYAMRDEESEGAVFVDGTAARDVVDLATRIRNALSGEPSPIAESAERAFGVATSSEEPIAGASRILAALLRSIGQADPALILLDCSGAPDAVFDLFGRMRDVLWQQGHRWIVAIDDNDRSTVMKPPADAFFDVVAQIEPWSTADLVNLLNHRYSPAEEVDKKLVMHAAANASGSPREALRAMSHGILDDGDPAAFLEERGVLLDRASRLGRTAGMLMAELLDRDQASPSEAELQDSLGLTRARLTQLFHVLQDNGLVVGEAERSSGPGRPRTIYRPKLRR
jgi:RecA/RadA recombinase